MFFIVLLVFPNHLRVAVREAKRQLEGASPEQMTATLASRKEHIKIVIERKKSLEGAPWPANAQDLRCERRIQSRNAARVSNIEKLRPRRGKDFTRKVDTLQQAIDREVGDTNSYSSSSSTSDN